MFRVEGTQERALADPAARREPRQTPLRMIHVVPHVDAEAAGPSYSVPRLCRSLADQGHDVELSCLAASDPVAGVRLDVHASWSIAGRYGISFSHARALRRKAAEVDVVHNHSLWSMVNFAAGWVVPGKKAMLVTSPRGTLSAWALNHSRRKKQLLRPLQWRALLRADLLHATSEAEYLQIRDAGCRAPVAVIPNGIDVPAFPAVGPRQEHRTLLYLGRIHPIKGIDRLLRAWRAVAAEHPDWVLEIAGGGEPQHVAEVHRLSAALKLNRVAFLGPLYGAEKSAAYCRAELFVLPSHSENFGMAVAEALAHGCPAIVTTGASWEGLDREVCGWWVSNEVDELAATLGLAMGLPSDRLAVMGRNGRAWMARDFGWQSIAERMTASYRYVAQGADAPACVRRH